MRYSSYIFQLVVSTMGFLLFSFFSGIVGSYAIEYTKSPSVLDKLIYSFSSSSYPYYACAFLLWSIIVIIVLYRKRRKTT